MQKGNLFIISAPSGAGKSSLVNALLQNDTRLKVSVSHTTRLPRPGEIDGVHYHFVSQEVFMQKIEDCEMFEYAKVYNNYYGTSKQEVDEATAKGFDLILEIDWQGANQVKQIYPDAISIFISVASIEVLEQRLLKRATDSEEVVKYRMTQAKSELAHAKEFDFEVVNDDFVIALNELQQIINKFRKV